NDGSGIWSVGNLGVGASTTLMIQAEVDLGSGGLWITNTASVAGLANMDANPANDSSEAVILVCYIDTDGDGCSDFVEGLLGTDANDGTDCPRTEVITYETNQHVDLRFHSVAGLNYQIQTTTNLNGVQVWQNLGTTNGSQPFTTFRHTNGLDGVNRRYYRIFYPSPPF
ncbi:MAG: hypothetical protein AAF492_04380, partial [Verrucomicrobiota bacterium]